MATPEERAREIKDVIDNVYWEYGCDNAQTSASFLDEEGMQRWLTPNRYAEPAKVTVDTKGKVDIIIRRSLLFPLGTKFDDLLEEIKSRLKKKGYSEVKEEFRNEFYLLDLSYEV